MEEASDRTLDIALWCVCVHTHTQHFVGLHDLDTETRILVQTVYAKANPSESTISDTGDWVFSPTGLSRLCGACSQLLHPRARSWACTFYSSPVPEACSQVTSPPRGQPYSLDKNVPRRDVSGRRLGACRAEPLVVRDSECGEGLVWGTYSVCYLQIAPFQHHWSRAWASKREVERKKEGKDRRQEKPNTSRGVRRHKSTSI